MPAAGAGGRAHVHLDCSKTCRQRVNEHYCRTARWPGGGTDDTERCKSETHARRGALAGRSEHACIEALNEDNVMVGDDMTTQATMMPMIGLEGGDSGAV